MPPKTSPFQNPPETLMPPKNKPTHRETTAASTSTSAADRFIQPEIVSNILSRLPVKYILRFQCVCKDWRTITSLEPFISAHLSRSPSLLLVRATETNQARHGMCSIRLSVPQSIVDRIDDFPGSDAAHFDGHLKVIGSLPNGVVCVSQNLFSDKLILWNPATRSTRSIIAPKLTPYLKIHIGASIGLGYDPSRDDIKIVRMLCHRDFATPNPVEFYSLNSGEWKIMKPDQIPKFCVAGYECDTVFKGVPYWRCMMNDEKLVERHMLVSFLPKEGVFEVESIDQVLRKHSWAVCMGEIMGRLGAVSWDIQGAVDGMFQVLDVLLKCEDSVWRKLYRVGPLPSIGRVLAFHGERGAVQEIYDHGNIRLFDLKKTDVTLYQLYSNNRVVPGTYKVVTFKESLTQIPEAGRLPI